ncbi:hypothetical protein GQ54DRAFT_300223 [Martensiomyces pterosporus]|nr:hypothetical protein GQ54DRAFT_300223 [Martensiomyces pterosporus]
MHPVSDRTSHHGQRMQTVLGDVNVQGIDGDVAVVPHDKDMAYTTQGLIQPALLERERALCVHDESCELQ